MSTKRLSLVCCRFRVGYFYKIAGNKKSPGRNPGF